MTQSFAIRDLDVYWLYNQSIPIQRSVMKWFRRPCSFRNVSSQTLEENESYLASHFLREIIDVTTVEAISLIEFTSCFRC